VPIQLALTTAETRIDVYWAESSGSAGTPPLLVAAGPASVPPTALNHPPSRHSTYSGAT